MQRKNNELWFSLLAIAIITAIYTFVVHCGTKPYRQPAVYSAT